MNDYGKRNSNMELLRMIAMIMIILNHITIHCLYPQLSDATSIAFYENGWFSVPEFFKRLLMLETMAPLGKTADAIFLLISGYYRVERGKNMDILKPVVKLITQVAFATVLLVLASTTFSRVVTESRVTLLGVKTFNTAWWFVGYYLGIIIFASVFLNEFLAKLSQRDYATFLAALFAIFSIGWTGKMLAGFSGQLRTFAAGVFLYSLGGYIKKYNPLGKVNVIWVILAFVFTYAMVYISYYNTTLTRIAKFAQLEEEDATFVQATTHYQDFSIVVLVLGIALFEIFRRINVGHIKVINILGAASFMVYLIHDNNFVRTIWNETDWITVLYEKPGQFCLMLAKWVAIIYGCGLCAYLIYTLIKSVFLLKGDWHETK